MLYNFLTPYGDQYLIFNLLRYITFRSGAALLTALFVSFIIAPSIIRKFTLLQNGGQPIREDGPETHLAKAGTPTMGGVIILLAVTISTLLWTDLSNQYILITVLVTLSFGLLGFVDDFLKVTKRNSKGVSGKAKILVQVVVSSIASLAIIYYLPANLASHMAVPFFKNILLNLGWFYIAFTIVVIIGASNAVNLTDGLDGLAIVPIAVASACFALISYLIGNAIFANYLQIHHVAGSGELAVFASAIVGASLGFLWYNAPPAEIFMGDTGSLALGGALGTMAVITKHELVLAIIGGLFVIEALSVIIQVYYFRFSGGKRIFRMAPIHHHYEKLGWSESKIVMRFWIIAIIFALIGLSTLKLR